MSDDPQDLSAILSALSQNYRPKIVRTINRRSVLMKTLPVIPGEGKNIAVDIETTGMVTENFTDGEEADDFGSDAVQPATLSWAMYRSNFRVTDLARAASRTSMTPLSILNLWGRNMVNAATSLASKINVESFTGPGTGTRIAGLDVALDDANTYMGINRSTPGNEGFQASVIDPGAPAAVSLSDIRGDINSTIYTACGEQPDLAFCAPAVFNTLGDLFTELRRYNDPVREINTAKGKIVLDASIGALDFEGCVFIKDKDAAAGTIYYLNSNYCRYEYLPQQDETEVMSQGTDVDLEDGFGPVPLGARFKKLATTGASEKASMQVFLNLVVEKPNACGVRKNVLTS